MELALAWLGAIGGAMILLGRMDTISVFTIAFYVALSLGGCVTVTGILRANLDVEASGLALLLGAYGFLALRGLSQAHSIWEIGLVLANAAALIVGFGVRLHVVRKAQHARRRTGRRLRRG